MKVALVGSAPSSKMLAPFNDPSWEIWACSPENALELPRVDRWFELHGDLLWPENQWWAADYVPWLNAQKFQLYAQDQSVFPRATPYPVREMTEKYGVFFFTSTFSWMMALALTEGVKEISLYGVDMSTDNEYKNQKPGFHHFLNIATNSGVIVSSPDECDVLQPPPLYGYCQSTPMGRKLAVRRVELAGRIEAQQRQRDECNQIITHLTGSLDDLTYMQTTWQGNQGYPDEDGPLKKMSGLKKSKPSTGEKTDG